MNETKVRAIVLGGIDYKEKDKLINLFTLEHGIVSVVFRGVKGANAKFKSAKEIFSFGDFIYTEGKSRVVISADIIENFYDIVKDIKKYYAGCAVLDTIKTLLGQEEQNPQAFIATLKSLKLIVEGVDVYNVLNKFLITVCSTIGYKFNFDCCNNCGKDLLGVFFNLGYGDIVCHLCVSGDYVELEGDILNAMNQYLNTKFEDIASLNINQKTAKDIFKILSASIKYRFGKKISLM